MRLYIPPELLNPGQRAFLESRAKMPFLSGGYGSGKTTGFILKMMQLVAANPGVPGLVNAPTWKLLWSVLYRKYYSMMMAMGVDRKEIPIVKDKLQECYIDFGGGTHVFLRSARNAESIEGLDVGWQLTDEARLITRKQKNIIIGRVRVPCPLPQSGFTSTPAMNWLNEEFNQGLPDRELIRAPTLENAHNLAPGYIDNLKLSYSPRLIKAILEGIFTILEGAVYEEFDPGNDSPWLVDYEHKTRIERTKQTDLAIDPGYRRSSILWIREIAPLQWVVFNQMSGENCSMSDMVLKVNQWNLANGVDIDRVWVDPAAEARDQAQGISVTRVLKRINFRYKTSIYHLRNPYRHIPLGVEKTRTLLGSPDDGLPIRLFFARAMNAKERGKERGIVKSLSSYSYPEVKDGRPITDIPEKDGVYDHDCDALRYWAMGKWLSDKRLRDLDSALDKSKGGLGFQLVQ